ncbi:PREDICTED: calmodulin-binding transcription activator 1-like [Amphimedon queenslandica]|uniref:CG-1 domain-containing protein n=1 Tax=Amphimedon queenslandica TaxID=400682 RepID=A0A1X7TK79_AMPQE|nr:PREDICTED: calmodulin-binding transcription activator 1-like [Amphimedon queenslandica]|eukprot:XP_019859152.1 PREDICTED: calmodulin-binding transcription activator 1-like [Amphimedon queenslandica]
MASASTDHPLLEQLRKDTKVSNDPGYSVIKVPTSPEGHMIKVVWPRTSFPRELHRWNLPEEILSYLISFDAHKDWVTTLRHTKPPSGTMLLFDKRKTKNYKVDGYDWKTRKHQAASVREDRTKLKVCGHTVSV